MYSLEVSSCDASVSVLVQLSPTQARLVRDLARSVDGAGAEIACAPSMALHDFAALGELDRERVLGEESYPVRLTEHPGLALLPIYQHLHVREQCVKNRWGVCDAW